MSKQSNERLLMIALITLVLLYLNACNAYKLTQQHQSVSKQTSTFNPAWFKDTEHMHAAILFQVKNGQISTPPLPAELRPGALPYRSQKGSQVTVVYFDSDEKEIGRYASEDPILARSCMTSGRGVQPLAQGFFEVLVPANRKISALTLISRNAKPVQYNIAKQMQTME